ncbi:hypothetical protein EVAR_41596_1 [Eumeta japonica]|uniref:Uncharacterized protein n=1 Tax=Eumeta variegata TaxID=151549 RepID=A0A4C1Y4M1_EUMVA|nr:hypothetical protein EVAR_41596_1 [Eumeta japonica]
MGRRPYKGAPRTRNGAERGERTRRDDACSADGRATDTRSYASSRRGTRAACTRAALYQKVYRRDTGVSCVVTYDVSNEDRN